MPMHSFLPLLTIILATTIGALSGCSSFTAAMDASPTLAHVMGIEEIPLEDLKQRYTNEYSRFVRIGDYNIHYQDQGAGEPVILMHGIFSSLQTWDGWVETLRQDHRVITLDMPGYGLTGAPEDLDDFTTDQMVSTVARFIDTLGLGRVSIAGNSLGGFIGASYAARYPGNVNKLILIDPFGYPQDTPWILDVATFAPVSFLGNYIQPALMVTMNVRWAYGESDRIRDEDAYRYVRMNQRPGAKPLYVRTLEIVDELASNAGPRPFNSVSAPTLLMWGAADDWVPVELANLWLQDIPNARLVTYPTVGHMPMEEIPGQTVADAVTFLNQGLAAFPLNGTQADPSDSSVQVGQALPAN